MMLRAIRGPGDRMARARRDTKFEIYGQEMLEKVVAKSGSSGRVYLPPDWIGKRVKVVRVD
ncbi:MAG: cytoplasmic protein [Euryarchaeota archaeon RBG_16_68_13]|nr:MAG: cytoplasmic protein [Euryarchaeota archaeon RBG_16_68_13]